MAHRILVFESDDEFASQVQAGFNRMGVDVEVVADANEGLQRATTSRPDLILVAVELPGMNGFLVCKKIKKHNDLKDIPLVLLSSHADAEGSFEQHKKLRTRAEDYIRKPIEFGDLLERVRKLVPVGDNGASPYRAAERPASDAPGTDLVIEEQPGAASADGVGVDREIEAFANRAFDNMVSPEEKEESTAIGSRPAGAEALAAEEEEALGRPSSSVAAAEGGIEFFDVESIPPAAAKAPSVREPPRPAPMPAPKSPASTGRELLDLREALNKKDKELLALKDQLSTRDKQLLEMRDANLELQRGKADFEDRILTHDRAVADARENIDALTADKDAANKRGEDLKTRLKRGELRTKQLEEELDAAQKTRIEDAANLKKQQSLAATELERKHADALQQAGDEHAADLASLRAEHASQIEKRQADQEAAIRKRDADHSATMKALRAQFEQAGESAALEHATELAAMREQHEEEHTRRAADSEALKEAELGELRDVHERATEQLRIELENKQRAEVERVEKAHNKELAVLGRKLAESEKQLTDSEGGRVLAEQDRDSLRAQLSETKTRVEELEKIQRGQASKLTKLEGTKKDLEAQLNRALNKIESDSELLERARRAVAIGLSLLEDQDKNSLE